MTRWSKSAPGRSSGGVGLSLLGICAGSHADFLHFARSQQVHRPLALQTGLLLQKEQNLSPGIETFILVQDSEHFLQDREHMAAFVELPHWEPGSLQPLFTPRQQPPRLQPLEYSRL